MCYNFLDIYVNKLKFIEINEANMDIDALANFISQFLCLNGVLIINSDKIKRGNLLEFFCDNKKMLKFKNDEFDDITSRLYQKNMYVENIYFIHKDKNIFFRVNNYVYSIERAHDELFCDMCQITNKCTAHCIPRIKIKNNKVLLCDRLYLCDLAENNDILSKIKEVKARNMSKIECLMLNDYEKDLISIYNAYNNKYFLCSCKEKDVLKDLYDHKLSNADMQYLKQIKNKIEKQLL